ncbi:MAG: hypothetical protein CVV41_04940 [Candidatus Riflebacteria bacterium HGW-Riflebacteria-1]|jgi:hypothetical protein|nr:MAG: hypothetical protein CVV41_04940 [Candidatus Riflebacteria bacterium HGW-Riflebacteria-1]
MFAFGSNCVYYGRMSNNQQILIISDNRKDLQKRLSAAALEKCHLTGLDSLRYISFTNLGAVVIDSHSIDKTLRKISLGIRDDDASDALWQLLSQPKSARVYFLVDKMQKPGSDMISLGIDYIIGENLEQLIKDSSSELNFSGNTENSSQSGQLLTADDIRSMHQLNIRHIPAGSRLTAWAAEIADSLNISQSSEQLQLIWPVAANNRAALEKMHEELFDLNTRHPGLLFLVNPALLPVFNSLYPALAGKTVSPIIHWASHGAFTGETSSAMLADLRCAGAIVPARKPYTDPKNLVSLIKQAKENSLSLFSTFTLASSGGCDIIASESSGTGALTPLYNAEMISDKELPTGPAAVVANHEFLKRIALRKGN